MDFLPEMALATRERGREAGLGDRVRPSAGDVTRLPFADGVFDLVVMLGVTEWVPPLDTLVSEAARVLKSSGHLIIAWNNRWGLHLILDPAANPVFRPFRRPLHDFLERRKWIAPRPREYRYSLKDFESAFQRHGLLPLRARGIGYGPLSVLWLRLPETLGHRINTRLQQYADARNPRLHSVARNFVALARKIETT